MSGTAVANQHLIFEFSVSHCLFCHSDLACLVSAKTPAECGMSLLRAALPFSLWRTGGGTGHPSLGPGQDGRWYGILSHLLYHPTSSSLDQPLIAHILLTLSALERAMAL